jgi:glycosyltransferase involved in cell wall biosynthesis
MSVQRPRLLFLSQSLPYPPDSGAKTRTYHLLRSLAGSFDVTALCFYRKASLRDSPAEVLKPLRQFARVEAFPIPQEYSALRALSDHIGSLLVRRAYTTFVYRDTRYSRRLRELLADEVWDLIHADSLDLSGYFPELVGAPLVCGHHDVQSGLLRQRSQHDGGTLRRWYLGTQASLMAKEELRWCSRVSLNITVSEADREALSRRVGGNYSVVPNGVDKSEFTPTSGEEAGCLFVGGSDWFPNLDAMEYFTCAILPILRSLALDMPVNWVGRITPAQTAAFGQSGITALGHVPDIRPYLGASICCIVPLRVGGGTRIKILEAWAMAKAVVSTSIGCEGLEARDGENILIRDDPRAFAEAIVELSQDLRLRARLGAQARRTVMERYDWDGIGHALQATYFHLLKKAWA